MLTMCYNDERKSTLKSMSALKGLAQEVIDMDEHERLSTLKYLVELELDKERIKNRFWILVAKYLLTRPEQLPSIISFAEQEISSAANPQYAIPHLAELSDYFQNTDLPTPSLNPKPE